MLRIDDITGTLKEGKFADLIVLENNPLNDIKNINTEDMRVIMKEGKFVKNEIGK